MEFVGEDLAALDAALAFLDEWDLDSMEDGLGALHVATSYVAPSAPGGDKSHTQYVINQQQQPPTVLGRMLEPEPFTAAGANMMIPMATETTGAGNEKATTLAAIAGGTASSSPVSVKSEPLSSSLDDLDDSLNSTATCPVEVDDKPRCKKKRRDDATAALSNANNTAAASQDPRALALQSVNLRVKRRRQKEELLELRQKVQQLETRLSQIKANSLTGASSPSAAGGVSTALARSSQDGALEKPRGPAIQYRSPLGLVWERLAARQLKERERVEEENQRLKDMLDEHVKLARSLDRILRKRATSQVTGNICYGGRCACMY